MKKIGILTLMLFAFSYFSFAQEHKCTGKGMGTEKVAVEKGNCHGDGMQMEKGQGKCMNMLPGLTEDQKKQMEAKKLVLQKEMMQLDNLIGEKKAKLRTLETADKADLAAINTTIDEMMQLKAEKMKKHAAHRQDIRKILNDEQRMIFDMHACKSGKMGKGHKGGNHGNGNGCSTGGAQGKCH